MVLLITLNGIKSVIKMICLAVWEGKKGKVQMSIFFTVTYLLLKDSERCNSKIIVLKWKKNVLFIFFVVAISFGSVTVRQFGHLKHAYCPD